MHLATCSVLRKVWLRFNRMVAATHRPSKLTPRLIFHAVDEEGRVLPPGLSALHLIMWKMVIYHFTMVQTEGTRFSPTNVWSSTISRLEVRISALAFKVKRKAIVALGQGNQIRDPVADSRKVAPLACFTEWGEVVTHEFIRTYRAEDDSPPVPAGK